MRGLGTKTITTTLLFILCSGVVWNLELLRPERLRNLDSSVPFVIGLFAFFCGSLFFLFWDFQTPSRYVFQWIRVKAMRSEDVILLRLRRVALIIRENKGAKGVDLPPTLQKVIYQVTFLLVGLLTFNNRSVHILKNLPDQITISPSRFCDEKKADRESKPEKLGCELLLRAYDLGYAKSLGSCAPDEDEEVKEICHLRREDEPYLHYAWRQLTDAMADLAWVFSEEYRKMQEERFSGQLRALRELFHFRKNAITTAPRSQHHLWTNFPHPEGGLISVLNESLSPNECLDRYARLPLSLEDPDHQSMSRKLDLMMGHILYSTRYDRMAGYCKEFVVHWNAGFDACKRLSEDPYTFLKEQGSLESVRDIFDRLKIRSTLSGLREELNRLQSEGGEGEHLKDEKGFKEVVSFQCVVENRASNSPSFSEQSTEIDGHSFAVRSLSLPVHDDNGRIEFRSYQDLARLFAKDFRYTPITSRAKIDPDLDEEAIRGSLSDPGFLLSRLEFLRNADIFLGHRWIQDRPDLLEVYPYHLHLYRFVTLFRESYRKEKGRL